MKVIGKLLLSSATRAFTKKNGAIISTKTIDGDWDLEALLAWFLRGLLLIALLYLAQTLNVDAKLIMDTLSVTP